MKHTIIFLACIIFSFKMFAQTGYYYGNEFIELATDSTSTYAIMPQDDSTGKKKAPKAASYHSLIYHTSSCKSIYILPEVIVRIKDGANIDETVAEFENISAIEKLRDNVFSLTCNVKTSEEVLALVKTLGEKDGIIWCEPNMYSGQLAATTNSNPLYSEQFYLKNTGQNGGTKDMDLNIEPAWGIVKGGSSTIIALLDTGVSLNHEDLKGNLLSGYTIGNPTGYGAPQNWTGTDKSHGTACAGILGAVDNALGVKGIMYAGKILPVNIAPYISTYAYPSGFAHNREIAEAIRWACNNNAKVLSCSWRLSSSNDVDEAINEAIANNVVVVAAAGNDGSSSVSFPASMENVIAVGAIDRNGKLCSFSNRGPKLDVVAFGSEITTTNTALTVGTTLVNDYTSGFNGTSAACPQVAGVVALMLEANPSLTVSDVISILHSTSRDLGAKGRDDQYGYGLVDAYQAVSEARKRGMTISGPDVIEKSGVYTINNLHEGCSVTWSLEQLSAALNGSQLSVTNNTPNTNNATVYNRASSASANKLKATIHFPNEDVSNLVLSRTIAGDGGLSGFYHEIYPDGSETLENPLMPDGFEDINMASTASDVIVQSDNFWNRQVSYKFSDALYGASRSVQVMDNRIVFPMPELNSGQTMLFTVSGGGISKTYNFTFGGKSSSLYSNSISIEQKEKGKIQVQVGNIGNIANYNGAKLTSPNGLYSVDVYNTTTMMKVGHYSFSEKEFVIDVSSLKHGLYIFSLTANGQTFSKKISLKF